MLARTPPATNRTTLLPTTPEHPAHDARRTGDCYEDIIDGLARRAIARAAATWPPQRVVVGVAGAPGSGKSTLATAVTQRINQLQSSESDTGGSSSSSSNSTSSSSIASSTSSSGSGSGGPFAVVLPMDGFHYYRRELDAMPDPRVGGGCVCGRDWV